MNLLNLANAANNQLGYDASREGNNVLLGSSTILRKLAFVLLVIHSYIRVGDVNQFVYFCTCLRRDENLSISYRVALAVSVCGCILRWATLSTSMQ